MILDKVNGVLRENYPQLQLSATVDEQRGIVTLAGDCESWEQLVDVGHDVGHIKEVANVVSDMTVQGKKASGKDYTKYRQSGIKNGVIDTADVVIVGAGVTGCGIARELSRYQLKIIVVEKGEDVATGATKANNGDIHPGYLEKPGYLKVALNVRGNAMYDDWARDLHFDLNRCGNMVVITDEAFRPQLEEALEQSKINGVYAEIVDRERALELEPAMMDNGIDPVAALHVPSMAVVEPWQVSIALAENAAMNGVKFIFNCTVADVLHEKGQVQGVITEKGVIKAPYIINCAGVYADEISEMAGDRCYTIHPRKGTIAIFDNATKPYKHLFRIIDDNHQVNTKVSSKGGGMGTTIEGNALLGPSATEVPDKEDLETSRGELAYAMTRNCMKSIGYHNIIRIFAGSRPATFKEDFVIEMSPVTCGFLNVGGIQSPGLASSPAIAERAIGLLLAYMEKQGCKPIRREDFNPVRPAKNEFRRMTREQQDALIIQKPEYGRIICRCEGITEGEILDAIHSPILPNSIDAIKRRTRAGMGRCQGGFCQSRVLELLARELGKEWIKINLKGEGSNVLLKDNRK